MGYLFKVSEGIDEVGSFVEIRLSENSIFEDARNEIMGRSYEDDHNEFNSFEEEQEAWEEFLGAFKGALTLLVHHEGGFRIYTVKENHLEKFSQIAASPSFFYAPGMSDKKEIEDYLASIEEQELELRASYSKTNFKCDELKINIKINTANKSLAGYLKKNKHDTYCYITAWNPGSVNKSEKINKKNNLLLAEDLKKYSFFPGLGTPGDGSECSPEESFLVFGIEEDKAIELMNKYGQKAIVYGSTADGARLIYDEEIEE